MCWSRVRHDLVRGMTRRGRPSLGLRLSWWLALQSLLGLLAVCVTVYVAIALRLEARQGETLADKQQQLLHILAETQRHHTPAALQHQLDDYFMGHQDMRLVLTQDGGAVVYATAALDGDGDGWRALQFHVASPLDPSQNLSATLTLDTEDDTALLQRLAGTLLAAAVGGALVISLGGFLLVRLSLQPVHQLVEHTRRIAADNLRHPLDGSNQPEELQPLIAQFNALLVRVAQAYEQLEGFNGDVAHELCTPLATLTSSVELAMRKPRSDEEMQELLGSNLEELQRMSAIVHDMLFLSQAERGATARRQPVASLAAVAAGVADYHEAALEEAGVSLQVHGDAAGDFDVPLLRRALSNLVGNATRYARTGSVIAVEIGRLPGGEVRIAVTNQGVTIGAAHLPRLFDRFYRGDRARSHADQNHGLGLAIVAGIARMHDGRTFAASDDGVTSIGVLIRATALP